MSMPAAVPHLLLTGGTGFFGRSLLRYWMDAGGGLAPQQVTLVSRDPGRFAKNYPEFQTCAWLELVQGDICDAASLPWGRTFTHVIHAAADSTLGPQLTNLQRFDQILSGTRHVLDLAVQSGARRMLFTSSGAVYGRQPPDLPQVPESWLGMPDPLNPDHAYGVAKRAAEHLCALYGQAGRLEVVVARCFAFVGPDLPLDVHFAIGNFIRDALQADHIAVSGDGAPLRSYLDQTDLARWLMLLLQEGRKGEAYNVGSDEAISIAALAHLVRDTLAPGKPVHILGSPGAGQGLRSIYVPDVRKIQAGLGACASVSLREAIARTARAAQTPA